HQVENARGDIFGLEFRIKILHRNSQCGRQRLLADLCRAKRGFLLGHRHTLRTPVFKTNFDGQYACSRLLQDMHTALLRGDNAQLGEKKPGADNRMPCQLQLFLRGKDAKPGESFVFGRLLDEDSLGEIHLARDREHLAGGKSVAVGDDGEASSLEPRGGKNIQSMKASFHKKFSRRLRIGDQIRLSCATVLSLVMFPVFKVDFGSMSTMWTSSSATGQCSMPLGTMTNSPSRTTASW